MDERSRANVVLSLLDGGIGNLCTVGSDGWVEEEEETGRLLSNGTKQIVGMSNRHALSCRRKRRSVKAQGKWRR